MNGTELAARFSYITNVLRYCGPKEAGEAFIKYVKNKDNKEEVAKAIKKFEGLYPYLRTIAEATEKDYLDYDVVEAYWIGNELLDELGDKEVSKAVERLMKRGLPKSIGEKAIKELPKGFPLHHDFNVMYVGVGNITGSVPVTLQNMENCRVSWGEVVKVQKGTLLVRKQPLKFISNEYVLGETETVNAVYLPKMLPDVKKGDIVALHWGFAPIILTREQQANLEKYTGRVRAITNEWLKSKR